VYPAVPLAAEPVMVTPFDLQELAEEVKRFITPVSCEGVVVDVVVRQGLPAPTILAEAEKSEANLIVIGTHGRSGFDRLVLGSVTERVLHKAPCAVLTVPRALDDVPTPATPLVKRILCAVDFSECSLEGLAQAVQLAQEADAHLTALSVITHELDNVSELSLAATGTGHMTREEFRRMRDTELLAKLEAAVPAEARSYCTVETTIAHGRPWREIVRVAGEQHADLIVMGVSGRGAVDLAMFGSTTHRVIRRARCPVLTIQCADRGQGPGDD
jgi:nucleotide-binding universal stress UspA family protein